MSSDNTIYCRQTPKGDWWVKHILSAHCWAGYWQSADDEEIDEMFEDKDTGYRVDTKTEAKKVAREMAEDTFPLEYGIMIWPREEGKDE